MAEIRANNVPDDFVTRFDIERAKRGRLSVREAVMQAIELWITAGNEAAVKAQPSRQHEHEHELLDMLLADSEQTAQTVRQVLHTFATAAAASRGKRAKQTKAG